jgi:hypothetical protein
MTSTEYISAVENKKGQFIKLGWSRPCKTRAANKDLRIEKKVSVVVRTGINYDNQAKVKEKRESGELPKENAGLQTNMEWESFPWIIKHSITGKQYARMYLTDHKPETQYFLNGSPATMEEISSYVLASELPKGEKPDCITVSLENIEELV